MLLADAMRHAPPVTAPARTLLREEIYARIREWIVEGVLPPDTRLRDTEIAEALAVSRMPVREALRRLEDEGLVVAEASRWTKVASLDTRAADHIYPIIWALERLAVQLGGTWSKERISEIRLANQHLARALAQEQALEASEADTEFHRLLVAAAANPDLDGIVADLKVRLRRIEVAYFGGAAAGERSVEEHEEVVAALERGDPEGAARLIEGNWRASLARLRDRQGAS